MKTIDAFKTFEEIIDVINAATIGRSVPYSGGTYTGSAERLAAMYAASAVEELHEDAPFEVEAHLEFLVDNGARFDIDEAAQIARRLLIERALDEARQELGDGATVAEIVAHVMCEDGTVFKLWDEGLRMDAVRLADVCEIAGGTCECAEIGSDGEIHPVPCSQRTTRTAMRFAFDDGSAIVVRGDCWDVEGSRPFTMAGAEG